MFKPPVSVVKKIKENQNMKTVAYNTQQAADEMYKRDPVVQHNLENFTVDNSYDPRFTGLVSSKDTAQLWEQPFEPIVGHTGLDVFPEVENETFQRKMEMFTGQEKTRYFSQKEAVVNDPRLMSPDPILNTAVPNAQERIDFYKQGLLRQGNVKPFESQLVGARHIQPLFRPLPKTGAERVVNPKKTIEYQTVTPPKSHVEKGALAAQTFKNKVDRAFAMDRLGFTTTGAVVKPAQYGTVDNKFQNRPETAPTGEQIFRNTSPFNNQALIMKGADNYTINTNKESLQNEYTGNAAPFNNQELSMKGPNNYSVNTIKEAVQQPYTGNAGTFNNQALAMKNADVYNVNTNKESLQNEYTGNAAPFNNQALAMKGADNYSINTFKENVMHTQHVGNTTPFNNQALAMKGADNYNVNTAKESLQHQYIGNTTPFNNQSLALRGPDNYTVNTAKESLQHQYIGNTTPFNNQALALRGPDNYNVNTNKESLQHQYIGNTTPFNNQALAMKNADVYNVNTAKESLQHQYIGNTTPFNNQALAMKNADVYNVNTNKESLQHQYIGNTSPFNNQSLAMKGADNYTVNTAKENVMTTNHTGNASPFNNQELSMKGADNYTVNTNKESLQHKYIGNTTPFNNQALAMKGADNYIVNTSKENVMTTNHTGNAAPFNDVEAQAAPLGAAHFISKDDVLKGRAPTMCGPNITNVDVNVAFNKRKQLLNVRNCTNGGTTSTERLTSSYKVKNTEIDISSRLDPCLNIPMIDNPYANAFLS